MNDISSDISQDLKDPEIDLITLVDILQADRTFVIELVEHSVIEPKGESPETWLFHSETIIVAKKAVSLNQDLNVNAPGVALAFDLLDQIQTLEEEIRILKK